MYNNCKDIKILSKSVKTFHASFVIGLESGYTQKPIDKNEIISSVQKWQDMKIEKDNTFLSASISECTIVLSGQIEPHLKFDFINYPKMKIPIQIFKDSVLELAKVLLVEFRQNRIVIEFSDKTVMLELSEEIDTRIKTKNPKSESIIDYTCIYCGKTENFSRTKLIAHLDIFHDDISELDKQEILKDHKFKVLNKSKLEKRKENKLVEKNKIINELNDYKETVINTLSSTNIHSRKLELIKSGKSLIKVKKIISSLKKEHRLLLSEAGIDFYVEPKKKKRKLKKVKNYYDKTINSIRTIYTPMGNKR